MKNERCTPALRIYSFHLNICARPRRAQHMSAKFSKAVFTFLLAELCLMKKRLFTCACILLCAILLVSSPCPSVGRQNKRPEPKSMRSDMKVIALDQGIYHGAFPDFGDVEDRVSDQAINDFEQAVDKPLAWAYFSNNWFVQRGDTLVPEIKFPSNAVEIIRNHQHYDPQRQHSIVPFIRMMPRSRWKSDAQGPSLQVAKHHRRPL